MHIAGIAVKPDARDSNLRLVQILCFEANGVKHRL
jgi:hypothetical protein